MTETLTALEGGHVPDPAPGATGAVFLPRPRLPRGSSSHRRRCTATPSRSGPGSDLDSRGTGRRALAATGPG